MVGKAAVSKSVRSLSTHNPALRLVLPAPVLNGAGSWGKAPARWRAGEVGAGAVACDP